MRHAETLIQELEAFEIRALALDGRDLTSFATVGERYPIPTRREAEAIAAEHRQTRRLFSFRFVVRPWLGPQPTPWITP